MHTFPLISYLSPEGKLSEDCPISLSHERLVHIYKTMVLTRLVDERMITLQRQGTISFALSSFGEEACAVASAAGLDNEDWLYPQYREVGALFWRGYSIEDYLHHMFGNAKDSILGRQMPNHFGSKALNVVTVSSPIGTKIPHAAGAAYGLKLKKSPHVALVYFGEGAASEGDFHAGLNFAAVRKAPAIFFCRNNGFAISTSTCNQFAGPDIVSRSIGYGIQGIRIDGNDIFAVIWAIEKAKQHGIEGHGPTLIEAVTYRLGAHSTSDDPTQYRHDAEVEKQMGLCPILRLKNYLALQGMWDEKQELAWESHVQNTITQAIQTAKSTPHPHLRSLVEDVYEKVPASLEEQYQALKRFFPEG